MTEPSRRALICEYGKPPIVGVVSEFFRQSFQDHNREIYYAQTKAWQDQTRERPPEIFKHGILSEDQYPIADAMAAKLWDGLFIPPIRDQGPFNSAVGYGAERYLQITGPRMGIGSSSSGHSVDGREFMVGQHEFRSIFAMAFPGIRRFGVE